MEERIQKIIAARAGMSRRRAEELIRLGRVRLNGNTAQLGDRADPALDVIEIDGERLPKLPEHVYLVLHKPRGFVTTMSDEQGRRTVCELVADCGARVYPVGRLDLNSEGLLLMTNDGDFANRVMHPSSGLIKTYRVRVDGDELEKRIARLREPFELDGVWVQAAELLVLKQSERQATLDISIREGRNREIRRMCDEAGLHVSRLTRIAEGALQLGDLPSGKYRSLRSEEIASVLGETR